MRPLTSVWGYSALLWKVGGNQSIAAFGMSMTIPGYLVIAAVLYSATLALAMMLFGRRLAHVIEEKNQAEAELKSRAAHLRHCGEGAAIATGVMNERSFVNSALDKVVSRWRELCHQLMRTTFVTHSNSVVAPVFALVICIPKYLGGAMSLGEVIQGAAAFVIVQGALNWFVDNYQRLADLLSSMNRVSSLLLALDQLGYNTGANGHLARELGVWPKTVRYWRKRWRTADDKRSVVERLADAPRSGSPATFTPEQICAVVAMTCEKPSESERPISHWSQREIADEAMRRGLVPSISQRSVGRFLKKRPTSSRIASGTG
jgi:hypothetical protein